MTVDYATSDGTADQGADYLAAAGSLSFAPGETAQTVAVALLDDGLTEPDEELFLDLSGAAGAAIVAPRGTGIIVDDESPPSLRIADARVIEGDSGFHHIYFGVSLSRPAAQPVSVQYATANGSAVAGLDYTAASGLLTFAPGSILETVSVEVLGDELAEGTETLVVNLSSPVGATIADGQATGRIHDQDSGISLSIGDAAATEGDRGTSGMVFVVSLSRPDFSGDVSVRYDNRRRHRRRGQRLSTGLGRSRHPGRTSARASSPCPSSATRSSSPASRTRRPSASSCPR